MVAYCRITALATWLLLLSVYLVTSSDERNNMTQFPFLGYVHGYKLGQNLALQLPPFLLSPVVIVPAVNNYQDIISKSIIDGNNVKHDDYTRNKNYTKAPVNYTLANNDSNINYLIIKDSLVKKLRLSDDENIDTLVNNSSVVESTERNDILNKTSTTEKEKSEVESQVINNITTKESGPYPTAMYNNEFLNNLTITMQQINNNFTLPNIKTQWQKFTSASNISNNNEISANINGSNKAEIAISPTTQSSVIPDLYPYPNAVSHSEVDKLSITTNSYLDEGSNLPPSHDDRWQSFTSLRKLYPNSGFRPLSGLYYDGFLYKTLNKKNGFVPYNKNHYYYE